MTSRRKKDSLIAGAITLLAMLLLTVLLVFGNISYDPGALAQTSEPEIGLIPEEEEFIEPELLQDLGEPNAKTRDEPAPAVKGAPKPAEQDNTQKIEPGRNPKKVPPVEKKVSTKRKQEVKSNEPSVTDKEKKEVSSRVAKGFVGQNGTSQGKDGATGGGGVGMGINGVASGRVFKGCPKPQVSLRHKVVVRVTVTIDADGKVIDAHAQGGASADIRRACEAAARSARWSAKPDAPTTKGTITFSITPV